MCLAHYSHDYTSLLDSLRRILDLEYPSLRRAISINQPSVPEVNETNALHSQGNGIVVIVISEHLDLDAASAAGIVGIEKAGVSRS